MPSTVPLDALTTRQKVKDYLSISDSTGDTIIDELITQVTAFIKNYCGGRNFLAADYVEMYDSFRYRRKIFLKQRPVNSITTVEYRSGTPTSVVWVVYNADAYLKYLDEGYVHFYAQLPEVHLGLRVSYNAGYLIDFTDEFNVVHHTLPQDITMVANELIAKVYNTRKAAGLLQESTEGQSLSYSFKSRELDDNSRNILAQYKLFRVAL